MVCRGHWVFFPHFLLLTDVSQGFDFDSDFDFGEDLQASDIDSILESLDNLDVKPKVYQKSLDEDGESLQRECGKLSSSSDSFEAKLDEEFSAYNVTKLQEIYHKLRSKSDFTPDKSRGSIKPINAEGPKPFAHQARSEKEEPKGCGNPVCVVIDRKPRRFESLSSFNRFMGEERPGDQINFVQKGDCYDIIENDGGRTKPWVDPSPALQMEDCERCRKDIYCGKEIVINVDLSSIIIGMSSAFGGDLFHPETNKRMAGVPMEFRSVCDAMLFFQVRNNLNIKTQILGYGLGTKLILYPQEGDRCLWTEWFDQNDPCGSVGDLETHSQHCSYLENSQTGPLRICNAEHIKLTQQQGGSEMTTISVDELMRGEGKGVPETNNTFGQLVERSNTRIQCQNKNQELGKLPAPFIYAEDLGVKCLDYKQRYCCKSTALYRPQNMKIFGRFFQATIPIGPTMSMVTRDTQGNITNIRFGITNSYGVSSPRESNLKIAGEVTNTNPQKQGRKIIFTGELVTSTEYTIPITGHLFETKLPDGDTRLEVTLIKRTDDKTVKFAEINVHLNKNDDPLSTIVHDLESGGTSETAIDLGASIPEKFVSKTKNPKELEALKAKTPGVFTSILKPAIGEAKNVSLTGWFEIIDFERTNPGNSVNEEQAEELNFWTQVQTLNNDIKFDYFIESPPLESLFAECQWKDWVNTNYPNKRLTGLEYEMRPLIAKKKEMAKTVCGDIPENAHYVDAVTVEDSVPWYELAVNKRTYETFKLTPFFGYACNDANMPDVEKAFCQDMKVRFCCAKKMRAQWGEWGDWEICSKTCGGGHQKRKRSCSVRNEEQETCFGQNSNEADKARYTEQQRRCAVENCPVNFNWGTWTSWTGCTVTCGRGHRMKYRSCNPAVGGGKGCPSKKSELELFQEEEPCSEPDCETFYETPWGPWSQVSVTCGVGVRSRSRQCASLKTLEIVNDRRCFPPGQILKKQHFVETTNSKLKDCPVNGGWTEWQPWQPCSQNCVYPKDQEGPKGTKAVKKRYKYCSNPIPAFGGEKCGPVDGFKYLSHENALMEKKKCKSTEEGGDLPYCPVACVFSSWSSWSPCTFTCISRPRLNFVPKAELALEDPVDIRIINDDVGQEMLPTRMRRSMLLRPAKNGGECPQLKQVARYNRGLEEEGNKPPFLEQREDCMLAKEHCVSHENNPKSDDQFTWPRLSYPGKDPRYVGYCPIDCEWGPQKEESCQKAQDAAFNETEGAQERCYAPLLVEVAADDEIKDLVDEMKERMDAKEIYEDPDSNDDPESLTSMKKKVCGRSRRGRKYRSRPCRRVRNVIRAFKEDLSEIYLLTTTTAVKQAILPNLDGLYGGAACKRSEDGAHLTKYLGEDDEEEDSSKYYGVEDWVEQRGACDLQLCPIFIDEEEEASHETPCISVWSAWE